MNNTATITAATAKQIYLAGVTQANNAFLATCTESLTQNNADAAAAHNRELLRLNAIYTATMIRIAG